ncbi:MAG: 4-hydroxy-tetrahydrodipicolinate synthase [Halobacteria archaeon]
MNEDVTEGTFPALVTPFDDDGEVDFDAYGDVIEHVESGGVDGLVPCGSTGESATLTHKEHKEVVEFAVEESDLPVIAGAGSNSTHEAVELTKHAEVAGADAALLISPYYNIPNSDGLKNHYRTVADAVDIPVILYNVPGRTGQNMPDDVVVELAEHPNVAAVKEASGDINQISRLCRRTRDLDFEVVSGDDSITLPLLSVGGSGVISVTSNLFPEAMTELVDAARDGDMETAREIHRDLLPVFDSMFVETNPIPVKLAMEELGICNGDLRLPLNRSVPETSVSEIMERVRNFSER